MPWALREFGSFIFCYCVVSAGDRIAQGLMRRIVVFADWAGYLVIEDIYPSVLAH